jgi:hypothetical protein
MMCPQRGLGATEAQREPKNSCYVMGNANPSVGCLSALDVFLLHPWHQTA